MVLENTAIGVKLLANWKEAFVQQADVRGRGYSSFISIRKEDRRFPFQGAPALITVFL